MTTSRRRLVAVLSGVAAVLTLLTASVVYTSHKDSDLREEIHSLAMSNVSMTRYLGSLDSAQSTPAGYREALRAFSTEHTLYLLHNPLGELQLVTANAIWAAPEVRVQLLAAIRDGGEGGSLLDHDMKFVWAQTPIPGTSTMLVTLHQEPDRMLRHFLQDYGLPLIILAAFMLWILIWVSLILCALFKKLDTQKVQLEAQSAQLAESRDEALAASQAKGTFLANMSHEIRTPLTAVIGYSEALLDSDQTKEDRIEAIKAIHQSSQHVLHIINQILDLSKIEANRLEIERAMVSPVQLLTEVSALMRLQARDKGLSFDVFYKTLIPEMMYTDATRLKQILLNLFGNAVKFTREGHVHINVTCLPSQQQMQFEVADSGIGMNEAQLARVFEAFTQADPSTTREFGGTGLGLTVSKQFAEMLGGGIAVASQPGRGSRFTVSIDTGKLDHVRLIEASSVQPDMQAGPVEGDATTYTGKVLLVEDVEVNRHLLGMYARKLGATVSFAENGEEAIAKALASPFDVILMDMHMPVMNGIDATQQLRENGYTGPIVALTADITSEARAQCGEAGCDDFLSKPVDRVGFNQVVSSYLTETHPAVETRPVVSLLLRDNPGLADMVEIFVDRLPGMLETIRLAIHAPDWEELKEIVHSLKGTGGLYGYPGITERAARMEFQITTEQRVGVEEVMRELEAYAARVYAGWPPPTDNVTALHDPARS